MKFNSKNSESNISEKHGEGFGVLGPWSYWLRLKTSMGDAKSNSAAASRGNSRQCSHLIGLGLNWDGREVMKCSICKHTFKALVKNGGEYTKKPKKQRGRSFLSSLSIISCR